MGLRAVLEREKKTPFMVLVKSAIDVEKTFRDLNKAGVGKLSGEAFLKGAMEKANTTLEKITTLRKTIEEREDLEASRAFVRNAIRQIREKSLSAPFLKPYHMRWLSLGRIEEVTAELAAFSANPYMLFAVAVLVATEKHPDCFGTVEDANAHTEKFRQIKALREDLFARIAKEYTPEDIQVGNITSKGMAYITFKVSNSEVPIAPFDNAGERLVNWLMDHPETNIGEGA